MNEKLTKKLYRKYPALYSERKLPSSQSRMRDGFCCGDGWYKIIDELSDKLTTITMYIPFMKITAAQVKEKFGTLRFYTRISFNEGWPKLDKKWKRIRYNLSSLVHDAVHVASDQSSRTCEECGDNFNVKSTTNGTWIITLCEQCTKKLKKNK